MQITAIHSSGNVLVQENGPVFEAYAVTRKRWTSLQALGLQPTHNRETSNPQTRNLKPPSPIYTINPGGVHIHYYYGSKSQNHNDSNYSMYGLFGNESKGWATASQWR